MLNFVYKPRKRCLPQHARSVRLKMNRQPGCPVILGSETSVTAHGPAAPSSHRLEPERVDPDCAQRGVRGDERRKNPL